MSVFTTNRILSEGMCAFAGKRRQLEAALQGARTEQAQKLAHIERLQGETDDLLLAGDPTDLKRHEEKISTGQQELAQAAAVIRKAEKEIEASLKLEPARRERLDAVNRDAPAVRRWLSDRYPKLIAELAKGAAQIKDLEGRIKIANADLPVGEGAVQGIEDSARHRPAPVAIVDALVLPPLIGGEVNVWPPNDWSTAKMPAV